MELLEDQKAELDSLREKGLQLENAAVASAGKAFHSRASISCLPITITFPSQLHRRQLHQLPNPIKPNLISCTNQPKSC